MKSGSPPWQACLTNHTVHASLFRYGEHTLIQALPAVSPTARFPQFPDPAQLWSGRFPQDRLGLLLAPR